MSCCYSFLSKVSEAFYDVFANIEELITDPEVDYGVVFTFLYATKTSQDHFQSKIIYKEGK